LFTAKDLAGLGWGHSLITDTQNYALAFEEAIGFRLDRHISSEYGTFILSGSDIEINLPPEIIETIICTGYFEDTLLSYPGIVEETFTCIGIIVEAIDVS
jgi:hypothetical protein